MDKEKESKYLYMLGYLLGILEGLGMQIENTKTCESIDYAKAKLKVFLNDMSKNME